MLDFEGGTSLYLQVADTIRRRIACGELMSGDPIPSELRIQQEYGIARTTARRAVQALRREGLVHTVQGAGTFVGPPGVSPRPARETPIYRQIALDIIDRITSGELPPCRRVPSETMLVRQYDVARETARRAVGLLREQGWLYTVAQRGSFVSAKEKWPEP